MCAACWNADEGNIARSVNTAVEGVNSNSFQFPDVKAENCCYCGKPTTSGIWTRADPEKMDCHHCDYPKCDELGPIGINETWCCLEHVEWVMDTVFKPLADAMKCDQG